MKCELKLKKGEEFCLKCGLSPENVVHDILIECPDGKRRNVNFFDKCYKTYWKMED